MGDNWKELLDEWAPIVAGVLGCFHATIPGWIEERTSDPESSHNTAKAIGKFIVFFVMVFVDSFVLICRAASAAAIGLINTMIVCIYCYSWLHLHLPVSSIVAHPPSLHEIVKSLSP